MRYALTSLRRAGANVYTDLDAGAYNALGWDREANGPLRRAVALIATTVAGAADGFASVDGFATNVGEYNPTVEPYFTIDTTVGGSPVYASTWGNWNSFVDERPSAPRVRTLLVEAGFSPRIGMVIDASCNGWGGPIGRPGPARQSASRRSWTAAAPIAAGTPGTGATRAMPTRGPGSPARSPNSSPTPTRPSSGPP